MSKQAKIAIALVLIAVGGFFLYKQFAGEGEVASDLEAMKESIAAPAKVEAADLTEEQKAALLDNLKKAQDSLVNFNFDHLQSVNAVGVYKKSLGDIEGAITAWEYANIIRPKNSLSFSNLAALYHYDLKQYDKAEENYLISLANDPDDINTIRNFFELYYYSIKDNAKAEGLLLKSIEENPEAADLHAVLAGFYEDQGDKVRAIEHYKKVLALKPDNEPVKKKVAELESQ